MADQVVGNAIPIAGEYNSTPPTVQDGKIKALQIDENGNLKVTGLAGGGSANTEYTEGQIDATPSGIVPMWRKSVDDSIVSVSDENPLPVSASINTAGLATEAEQQTQTTHLAAIQTAVQLLDNIVAGSEAQVDVVSSALPTGAATAANQSTIASHLSNIDAGKLEEATFIARVGEVQASPTANTILGRLKSVEDKLDTLETTANAIQAATETIDNVVAGSEAQVDVVTLPSLPAGVNNIGDVDVLTVPADPFGTNADAAVAAGAAGSIQAKLRRLTADIDAIRTAVQTLDNIVAGSEAQVDVLTLPNVTVGSALPAGSNNIGDVDIASALPAGNNNIGDVDVASQPARDRLSDNVGVALQTDAIMNDVTALTPKFAAIDAATSGDNTLVAAVASKKIRVLALFLVSAGDVTARLESGAGGTALTGQMTLTASTGFVLPFNPVGWFETAVNTLLNLELSGAVSVDGSLVYVEV